MLDAAATQRGGAPPPSSPAFRLRQQRAFSIRPQLAAGTTAAGSGCRAGPAFAPRLGVPCQLSNLSLGQPRCLPAAMDLRSRSDPPRPNPLQVAGGDWEGGEVVDAGVVVLGAVGGEGGVVLRWDHCSSSSRYLACRYRGTTYPQESAMRSTSTTTTARLPRRQHPAAGRRRPIAARRAGRSVTARGGAGSAAARTRRRT
jgi:hypothetical protein